MPSLARKKLAERNLRDFAAQAWHIVEPGPFHDNWHVHAICEHLEACTLGQIQNLLINVPPRFLKSLLVSVFWFCWSWIRRPETRWMFSSYSQSLSTRDSIKCRNVLTSSWFQSRWGDCFQFLPDQNQKTRFDNTQTGFRLATSVGGIATGEGGDFIVSDDPHNVLDVESDVQRESVLNWWDHSMSTRGNRPGETCRVIVMQRIHERDLSGHVLEQGGYEHLCLPMHFDPARSRVTSIGWRDPRTAEDELLHPARFPVAAVADLERRLGNQAAGQLEQRPSPKQGALFQESYFLYFRVVQLFDTEVQSPEVQATIRAGRPHKEGLREAFVLTDRQGNQHRWFAWQCWWFQAIDTAIKAGQQNDFTVCTTFAVTPDFQILVYDVWREKIEVPRQYAAVCARRERFPQVEFQAVEDKASGSGLIQQSVLDGRPFVGLKGEQSGETRALAMLIYYQAGSVYHRAAAPWLMATEDELRTFPNGAHDDIVTTLSYGGQVVQERAAKQPRIREIDLEAEQKRRQEAERAAAATLQNGQRESELNKVFARMEN